VSIKKENNFNLDSFCPEVYNQIQIDSTGEYKICCLAVYSHDRGNALDKNNKPMNIMTHSLEEAMNSETHKSQRLEFSNNLKPQRCINCYDSENSTKTSEHAIKTNAKAGFSKRQGMLSVTKKLSYITVNEANAATDIDGSIDTSETKLVNLDLRFSNLCNLKCIMCDPGHSSGWYEDWDKLAKTQTNLNSDGRSLDDYRTGVDPLTGKTQFWKGRYKVYNLSKDHRNKFVLEEHQKWWDSPQWWQKFEKVIPQLKQIYFTGGEPLLVPSMEECLNKLIENNFSKNIILQYDTNLTVINKKIIDKWKHFKHVMLCISVDDIEEKYNLIRFPGDYNKFKENILKIKSEGIPINHISGCIGIASPYSVLRIVELAKELNVDTFMRFLYAPKWLNIQFLPRSAKEEIVYELEKHLTGSDKNERWITAEINYLKNNLDTIPYLSEDTENNPEKFRNDALTAFVKTMNNLDEIRNTDWKSVLTDVVGIFQRHCSNIDLNSK
jgi:MoaA/NifB/PqqE/SkfB family radical SAM enzyme